MGPTQSRITFSSSSAAAGTLAVSLGLILCAGCGETGTTGGPRTGGDTTVTLLVSSTANDQVSQFALFLNSLTLISDSGSTVSLLPSPQQVEFIHLNGLAEPLVTVSVPQGVYASALATVGHAQFVCVAYNPSISEGLEENSFTYGYTPNSQVTVSMPAGLTIAGSSMGLLLNLEVPRSESMVSDSCSAASAGSGVTFSITPTFYLTGFAISARPTSPGTGKLTALHGAVASLGTGSTTFTVAAADGPATETLNPSGTQITSTGVLWNVRVTDATNYQGISGVADLTVGTAVELDGTLQPDGSVLATRVEVEDADAAGLSALNGPLVESVSWTPVLVQLSQQWSGPLAEVAGVPYYAGNFWGFGYDSAVFQTSGQFGNLQNLPFPAIFSAGTAVAGQSVSLTSHAASMSDLTPATTIALTPQTIDGTVSAIAQEGEFTVYTVTLAPYDLFPTLAFSDSYQISPLTSPDTVFVYADSSTQMLNTESAAIGGVLRFTGLVFNDNGTLRMDCSQVTDGVPK